MQQGSAVILQAVFICVYQKNQTMENMVVLNGLYLSNIGEFKSYSVLTKVRVPNKFWGIR